MTSGSAMGIFIMSELAIPEAFAVWTSTENESGEQSHAILIGCRGNTDQC